MDRDVSLDRPYGSVDSTSVWVLAPPYTTFSRFAGAAELGSVLAVEVDDSATALVEGIRAWYAAPWCPICLINAARLTYRDVSVLVQFDTSFALLHGRPTKGLEAGHILHAVRQRPLPTVLALARYVALRIRRREAVPILHSALLPRRIIGEETLVPPRTLSRQVKQLGPLSVANWIGIAHLLRIVLSHSVRTPVESLERLALDNDVDPRSLRRWLRLCSDLPIQAVLQRPGWEWLMESSLRKWNYFREDGDRMVGPANRGMAGA